MSHANKELYEFSNFRLDVSERTLLRDGKCVPLPEKAFDTLCALVRRGGRLAGKDELLTEIWADAIVEENNLDKNVSFLRQRLGEKKGKRKFIETVRGHGYRFIAEVQRIDDSGFRISDFGFQSESHNGNGRPTATDELTTEDRRPKTEDQKLNTKDRIQNTKYKIQNPKSNVVALAAWRHEAEDAANEETETEKATNSETQIVSPAFETIEPERVASIEPFHLAPAKSKSPKNGFALAAIVSLAALAGIGFGFYKFFNRQPIEFRVDKITQFTTTGKTKIAAVSPDGKYLANVQENDDEQSLWLRQVTGENNIQILPPAAVKLRGLNFSPDGNRIFYVVENALFQIPALGGSPKKVLENIGGNGVGFSPDGKQFAFLRYSKEDSAIFIADADGGDERRLYSLPRPESLTNFPAWSPDGKVIACSVRRARADNYVLAVQVEGGSAAPINSQPATNISQLAWLPDSKSLLMIGVAENKTSTVARIYQMSYPGAELRRVTNDFSPYVNFSLTADGRSLFAVRLEIIAHVWTMPGNDANQIKQLTAGQDKYDGMFGMGWMPDGRIFYESKPGGRAETVVMNADGGNAKPALKDGYMTTVSPDGRFFVYQKAVPDEEIGLFRLDLSDNTEKRLTTGFDRWATVAPDGKQVLFTRYGEQMGAYRVSIDGGEPTKIFDGAAYTPTASPDGKQIAFYLSKGKQSGIAIMPFEGGGEPTRIFEVGFSSAGAIPEPALQWTPDGRAINYIVTRDGVSNIWRQSIDGGAPVQITNFTINRLFNFAFSPDGSQLALSRGTSNNDAVLIENFK